MTIEKRVDFNAIKGLEFRCQCGGRATVEIDDEGILCDVNSPDVVMRVVMKPIRPGQNPWTAWNIREDGAD